GEPDRRPRHEPRLARRAPSRTRHPRGARVRNSGLFRLRAKHAERREARAAARELQHGHGCAANWRDTHSAKRRRARLRRSTVSRRSRAKLHDAWVVSRDSESIFRPDRYGRAMSIDILTDDDLAELTSHRDEASVSLYITTGAEPAGPVINDAEAARTVLRSALKDAARELESIGVSTRVRDGIAEAVESI